MEKYNILELEKVIYVKKETKYDEFLEYSINRNSMSCTKITRDPYYDNIEYNIEFIGLENRDMFIPDKIIILADSSSNSANCHIKKMDYIYNLRKIGLQRNVLLVPMFFYKDNCNVKPKGEFQEYHSRNICSFIKSIGNNTGSEYYEYILKLIQNTNIDIKKTTLWINSSISTFILNHVINNNIDNINIVVTNSFYSVLHGKVYKDNVKCIRYTNDPYGFELTDNDIIIPRRCNFNYICEFILLKIINQIIY